MIFREKLNEELKIKQFDFQRHSNQQAIEAETFLNLLLLLEKSESNELAQRFANIDWAGAIPAGELVKDKSFCFPFKQTWENHEHARQWAGEMLDKRTTFAADGSQIFAAKETSVPVAAVQIGWFENPHDESKPYEKNASFEILTPSDLFKDLEDPMNPDIRVEERRYLGEVARIEEFLQKKKGWRARGERMPLAFFDNPLLVPFSQKGLQSSFLKATVELVKHSKATQVPLVGYVDRSFSKDLLTMLAGFASDKASSTTLYDASILKSGDPCILQSWGDRTCFCYSKRRGLEDFDDPATGRSTVGFTYLQTAADSTPARLDIPSWVYEAELLDEVIDVVRAECVVGLGYPYALEAADQTAVISPRDREVFFRALQDFATREKFVFSVSRKNTSKGRRR